MSENSYISNNTDINDIRTPSQFKGISFSKFKKTDVRKQMIQSMIKGKIEPACYWCAELICAGHFMEAWEIILHYTGKHIHLGNPKLAIYLHMRFEVFREIVGQSHFVNEIELRNNDKIRKLFAELICTLTMSNKKHSFEPIKINRVEEFDMTQMTERLKAPVITYVEPIFKKGDPKELFIAVNEFAFCIASDAPNIISACYWIEWMIEFDIICKKRKEPCLCERRSHLAVENKYQRDIIWLIWDALLYYSKIRENAFIDKIMDAILGLFCIKYTTGASKKRRYLLYFAVGLLTEPVQTNVEIISNKPVLQNVVEKIGEVYKQIKKNEDAPKTDYLFKNLEKQQNLEKSMKKMEILGQMDTAFKIS